MLKKILIGGEEGEYWIATGDIPLGGGAADGPAFSWPLSVNEDRIFMGGSGLPSSDSQILCISNTGQLDWSASLAETLDVGPPRVGQANGFGTACDDTYVVGVHEVEDDNYATGSRGVIQCRTIADGALVFQKVLTNGRTTHVCAENGYAYVGLSADTDHYFNYARVNLVNGTVSGTGIRYNPGGNPMRMACDTGSSVYALTTDTSVGINNATDNSQILRLTATGTISASVKIDATFLESSYINSNRADLDVLRTGGVDYVYTFSQNQASDTLNVIKFSTINGASSTIDWQKGITRAGWTVGSTFLAGSADSDGHAYVYASWSDGGGTTENTLHKLNSSTGALEDALSIKYSGASFTIRGMKVQPTGVVLVGNASTLIRIPTSLSVSGTYGDYVFAATTDYTVATSSITISAGTVSDVGDSYSLGVGSIGTDTDVTSSVSLIKTEMDDVA